MLKKLGFLAVLIVLVFAAYASAANLIVDGGTIQAGVDSTLYCDVDGVQVKGWGLETSDNTVRSVRIGDISSACFGNAMFIKVLDVNGNILAEGEVDPINSSSVSISFNKFVIPEKIEQLKVWIEGEF